MQLIRYLNSFPEDLRGGVLTIGNFDGVHQGHQRVIKRVQTLSETYACPSLVMTFEPTPKEFFMRENAPARLFTWRERYEKLKRSGCDGLLQLKFDERLANMDAFNFVRDILVDTLQIRHLVIGDDFHFGKNRSGNFSLLRSAGKELGFKLEDTQTLQLDSKRVSSTAIRDALNDGNFDLVEELLGEPYCMSGRVVHGQKLGRTLGFPTLNISVKRQVSPLHGIYMVKVHGLSDKPLPAVASIGTRPAVNGKSWILEVHILEHDRDHYGQRAEIEFCCFQRPERNFPDLEKLTEQMQLDLAEAKEYFGL